jgi:hypothetical protein
LFPNVRAANDPIERRALVDRYNKARQKAVLRGCDNVLTDFEAAVTKSQAVIARSLQEADRLALGDHEIYATFYQWRESGIRLPVGGKWDVLRGVADIALFTGYEEQIRFAALSLDGLGLSKYGDCFLVLSDKMIAHRASVFEENSVIFMDRHGIRMAEAHNLPKGYRATWEERGKLAATKHVDEIGPSTESSCYSRLLLREGESAEKDRFIEVHIWGPMTARSFDRVIAKKPETRAKRVFLTAMRERFGKLGVNLEVLK